MSTMVLDSAAAIQRALAAIGTDDGAGACLANVYQWFGGPAWSSTGPGAGRLARAIDAWNYAAYKDPGNWNPPAGVPVYFGTETRRTDKNAGAGDVALSIGGGRIIATDSPTGRPGIMMIKGRAKQIDRNYLGPAWDFPGYPVSGALSFIAERNGAHQTVTPPIVVTQQIPQEVLPMFSIVNDERGTNQLVSLLTGKRVPIEGPKHVAVLLRVRANTGTDQMNSAELNTFAHYMQLLAA